ncbi:hypothetical protein BY996DRAFT_6519163 [Phakopsora pachyrhizi]|nr:hypothetical protein BY996DRAFT_6519163 [Phakopsora pachyrhizi]
MEEVWAGPVLSELITFMFSLPRSRLRALGPLWNKIDFVSKINCVSKVEEEVEGRSGCLVGFEFNPYLNTKGWSWLV